MTKHLRYRHFEITLQPDGTPLVLGRGSMGVTYKAFDTNLHCHVALKIIAPDLLGDELTRERFQREARVAAAIRHPNVAAVSYLGEEEGEIFYAMEFVEGITLDQEIRDHSRLAPSKALEIALQVCRALAALHRQGLVHRDIKPSNVMLTEAGEEDFRVKLVDFGLAKFLAGNFTSPALAQASAAGFHGTPYYASPEQINGQEVDIRSDIYSLGATIFTTLSGHVPFSGSFAQVLSQHLTKPPPLEAIGDLPPDIRALVGRMLAKNPGDRFQTPAELRAALEAICQMIRPPRDHPSPAKSAGFAAPAQPPSAGVPSQLTLLELMKRRRALPLKEALVLLDRIAAKLDALESAALPCPALTLGDVIIEPPELFDQRLDASRTVNIALPGEQTDIGMVNTPNATIVPPLDLAPESQTGPRVLARLGYEMLGGMRGESAGRWTPLPSLSAHGNAALRRAIEERDAYQSAAELVAALRPEAKPSSRRSSDRATPRQLPAAQPANVSPVQTQPIPKKSHFAALYAVIGLSAIFVVLVVGTGFLFLRPEPLPTPSISASPEPAPTHENAAGKPASLDKPAEKKAAIEKPEQKADPSAAFLVAAENAKRRDDDAGAFENFSRALDASPGLKGPKEEMEMIAARLRSNAVELTPEKFAILRASLEQAANHDVLSAQMLLGEGLRKSDPQTALKWFAAAAAQGQTEAMTQAGLMMANGLGNDAPDFSAAVAWFQQGAAGGDSDAMVSLADCLLHGKGIAKNEAQAIELLRTAAALNHPNAMNTLGDLLKKGIPGLLDPNLGEAFRLFARARDMGFLDAQANLGVMYVNGLGVPVDRNQAFSLWKDGAAQGNALSMFFYAMALEGGLTGPPQPAEARQWYLEAAKRGNAAATAWCRRNGAHTEMAPSP
jgi:TPR repeat protein/predicted Ser/Thr protein kinase